jgi:hypothetical protein
MSAPQKPPAPVPDADVLQRIAAALERLAATTAWRATAGEPRGLSPWNLAGFCSPDLDDRREQRSQFMT